MTIAAARVRFAEAAPVRERRCIVTGDVLPAEKLIRFVVGPDGHIVPDLAARLPGRGIWLTATRDLLERAVAKNQFSRAAKVPVLVSAGLSDLVERLLVARMSGDLGLARRSGQAVLGFDNIVRAFEGKSPPVALFDAVDGAADGRRKLARIAVARGCAPLIIACLTNAELSLALGRENVVHAALKSGRLAERLISEAGRLHGFRPHSSWIESQTAVAAGPTPARDEG